MTEELAKFIRALDNAFSDAVESELNNAVHGYSRASRNQSKISADIFKDIRRALRDANINMETE